MPLTAAAGNAASGLDVGRYQRHRSEHPVAFSCKRRGFCPSCGARRCGDPLFQSHGYAERSLHAAQTLAAVAGRLVAGLDCARRDGHSLARGTSARELFRAAGPLDFPGKYRLERHFVARPRILAALNKIRFRAGRPAFELENGTD